MRNPSQLAHSHRRLFALMVAGIPALGLVISAAWKSPLASAERLSSRPNPQITAGPTPPPYFAPAANFDVGAAFCAEAAAESAITKTMVSGSLHEVDMASCSFRNGW